MPTIETMKIKLADEFGGILTSRGRAAAMRADLEASLATGEQVVVDLEGVETMSPSFADEVFAKLAPHVEAGRVRFEHVPSTIEPLVRFVVGNRLPA